MAETSKAFPYCEARDLQGLLWTHTALLSLAVILIVASLLSQIKEPAPYGRHAAPEKEKAWGPPIPQRLGHIVSDALPGIPLFIAVLVLYVRLLPRQGEVQAATIVLALGWLVHYIYRGIIHPLIMPYSSATVALGITLGGIFPNAIFAYMIAAQLACTVYPSDWVRQPRFIIGVIMYGLGCLTNRWADLTLRAGRLARQRAAQDATAPLVVHPAAGAPRGDAQGEAQAQVPPSPAAPAPGTTAGADAVPSRYFIPRGGLFELVSCPNYLGELVQWAGYALACWSWPALAWVLFGAATFIPRSLTHHRWYTKTFGDQYPARRKALIPFLL